MILVAVNRRWLFLVALAAAGTILMQIGWADEFFTREKYFEGNKILIALGVLLGFNALYLAAAWWAKQRNQLGWWLTGSKLALAATALIFTAWFLSFAPLAQRPWLMFSFVFLIDLSRRGARDAGRESVPRPTACRAGGVRPARALDRQLAHQGTA